MEFLARLRSARDENAKKEVMMDIVDIIIEQIKQRGIESHVSGDVNIEVRNNYAPVAVKVPVKYWLSSHIKSLLTHYSSELGGYCVRENERGLLFRLTSDEDINRYFSRMLSSCRCSVSIIFTDSRREVILDKKTDIKLSEFFIDKENSMYISEMPMSKVKKCSIPGNRADDIDLIRV